MWWKRNSNDLILRTINWKLKLERRSREDRVEAARRCIIPRMWGDFPFQTLFSNFPLSRLSSSSSSPRVSSLVDWISNSFSSLFVFISIHSQCKVDKWAGIKSERNSFLSPPEKLLSAISGTKKERTELCQWVVLKFSGFSRCHQLIEGRY